MSEQRQDDHPTPGEWNVLVWDKNVCVHGGPDNDDIAEFNFSDEHTVKIPKNEAIANAVLFAASKDLLESARYLSKLSEGILVAGLSNETAESLRVAWTAMDAAIAKASVQP